MQEMELGLVLWLTGLAGSGKSSIGRELYTQMKQEYAHVVYLDGDELRELLGVYSYDRQGRIAVAKKRSNFARFLSQQGIITIVTTISMFSEIYRYNRARLENYLEVYIHCEWEELLRRDQKSLYSRARSGALADVVGVDIAYDVPSAHLQIDNSICGDLAGKAREIFTLARPKLSKHPMGISL